MLSILLKMWGETKSRVDSIDFPCGRSIME